MAAFGLGNNDKMIGMQDSEGIALAAIQGLNAKVGSALEEQAATILAQQHQLAELSDRLQRAEMLAADVVALKAALTELQRARQTVVVR